MNAIDLLTNALRGDRLGKKTTIAIATGVAIGAIIGALFLSKGKRKFKADFENLINQLTGNTPKNARQKLGNLVADVRVHIKQNADGLLGDSVQRNGPSAIQVSGMPSNTWKKEFTAN